MSVWLIEAWVSSAEPQSGRKEKFIVVSPGIDGPLDAIAHALEFVESALIKRDPPESLDLVCRVEHLAEEVIEQEQQKLSESE